MNIYKGAGASGGIALGRLRIYREEKNKTDRTAIRDTESEIARFRTAAEQAERQLSALRKQAMQEAGEAGAAIFRAHQMLLGDPGYTEAAENLIRGKKVNAEYALSAVTEEMANKFAASDDDYMRERAADLRDVSGRVIRLLEGRGEGIPVDVSECVLVTDELSPGEVMQMEKKRPAAIVTRCGSVRSHTAILARAMGIPAVVGTDIPLSRDKEGKCAVVNGDEGCVCVEPDEETMERMRAAMLDKKNEKDILSLLKAQPSVTLDGQAMPVCANIGGVEDIKAALDNGAEGIGLFRSEFLYLGREDYPDEEEQFQAYKSVLEAMPGKTVVIRTMDLGADKQEAYMGIRSEKNPAMGMRGIRFSLTQTEVFKTQLRALLRASAYGNLSILYPMISSPEEMHPLEKILRTVKGELDGEEIPYGKLRQGIMIETPAAALLSDLLAKDADFFSIGTNDLAQYTLAMDRENDEIAPFFDGQHPALLRLIRMTVDRAHKAGIECEICGDMATDLSLTGVFLSYGVDQLSVPPKDILPLRRRIRESRVKNKADK